MTYTTKGLTREEAEIDAPDYTFASFKCFEDALEAYQRMSKKDIMDWCAFHNVNINGEPGQLCTDWETIFMQAYASKSDANPIAKMLNIPAKSGTYIFDTARGPRAFEYHQASPQSHLSETIYSADAPNGKSNGAFSVSPWTKAAENNFSQRFGVHPSALLGAAVYKMRGATPISRFPKTRDDPEYWTIIRGGEQ